MIGVQGNLDSAECRNLNGTHTPISPGTLSFPSNNQARFTGKESILKRPCARDTLRFATLSRNQLLHRSIGPKDES